ncbi:D-alanyl-D-alanine carboxypeptidase family protein [Streptomyces tsukubensis]|uniref:D-alanyl-D-alanine carboxypeptidase n=1 Tax=Streptomyces tsukubensis TaxID=83656 RepID=A0A1V4A3S2_9ACTN|nr:D-alanyl-D-alanine carboxypeptidase [Streptomyces tsukubensis]
MSDLGGSRLGRAGSQVDSGAGVPALPKELSARSWIVSDAKSGDVLAAHNAHWRLPPASTLKMLFADTLLPKFPKAETHRVATDDLAGIGEGSSLVGVQEAETYSVHDLWLGVFLRSGNDAVHVLSAMNGGVAATVKDMQHQADKLQARDTHVISPDGYDADGQLSSAYDLTLFARSGLQNKDFREYCSTAVAEFPGGGEGKKREHFQIQNTNRLLTGAYGLDPYKGIGGVKNGNTTNAGATFTGMAKRGGKELLVTVMNPDSGESQAVYKEAERLLDWGFAADGKAEPVGKLVGPADARTEQAGSGSSHGKDDPGSTAGKPAAASTAQGSSGLGTTLAIAGGVLVVLAGFVIILRRARPVSGGASGSGPVGGASGAGGSRGGRRARGTNRSRGSHRN